MYSKPWMTKQDYDMQQSYRLKDIFWERNKDISKQSWVKTVHDQQGNTTKDTWRNNILKKGRQMKKEILQDEQRGEKN